MFVKDTIAVSRFTVTEQDLNYIGVLFGGKLLSEVDTALAQAARKATTEKMVTGAVDKFRFIKQINLGETVTIKAQVSGVSKRSIEVLGQVYNDDDELSAYAILTFIILDKNAAAPEIIPETEFEKEMLGGYAKRAKVAKKFHNLVQEKLDLE